jgi:hypothetical protein
MADVQGRQLVPVETEDTHTPPDPRAQALANAQAHGEDLHHRLPYQPPPASLQPRCNSELNARNIVGDTWARARQVQQAIIADANAPPPPHVVCAGLVEHRRRSDAPAQPAQACRPSTAGAPPQHPDVGGACRRAASGKFHVTPPVCSLLPSWEGRLVAAKPLNPPIARAPNPGGSQCHGCTMH